MSTAVGRLCLDELKVKPMPNKKQKDGIIAVFGEVIKALSSF